MLFNSFEFILVFFPIAFCGFFLAAKAHPRLALAWLALASIVFYGYWNPKFVLLLLLSIGINFRAGRLIENAGNKASKKRWLTLAIVANMVVLGIFKYTNFFIATINTVSGARWGLFDLVLPLGISFFTFTQITYLVDTYRGRVKEHDFIAYVLFVNYFPHLIAGPLLHHESVMPQFFSPATFRVHVSNVLTGLAIFSVGLSKKILLADAFAGYADPVFDAAASGTQVSALDAWLGALAYTFQLYFDFSGYSDMAVGLSKMFGIHIIWNFNSPYKAQNIADFWRRWHISLSQFLRDYLYIPLGGNRLGPLRRHMNLVVTMLLGGLWHGAGLTFVLWGLMHGVYLLIYHLWMAPRQAKRAELSHLRKGAGVFATFLIVLLAWVMFRADNVGAALSVYRSMVTIGDNALVVSTVAWGSKLQYLMAAGAAIVWLAPNTQTCLMAEATPPGDLAGLAWRYPSLCALVTGGLFLTCLYQMSVQPRAAFIYFQF